MPKESNLELKVGVFVVLAIACLMAFIFSISDFSIFKGGQVYRVVFHYANGLKKSAPVRIAGVDAGHVRTIQAYFDRDRGKVMVALEAWVDTGMMIPADSTFEVNQLGLLGEKYLEILPGISKDVIKPGAVVVGEDPVSMEALMKQFSDIGPKIEMALSAINNGILTETNKRSLAEILSNVALMTDKINTGVLSDANNQALASTLTNIASVTDKVNKSEGTVGKLLTDPAFYNNLEEFSADVKSNPWKLFYRSKGK